MVGRSRDQGGQGLIHRWGIVVEGGSNVEMIVLAAGWCGGEGIVNVRARESRERGKGVVHQ